MRLLALTALFSAAYAACWTDSGSGSGPTPSGLIVCDKPTSIELIFNIAGGCDSTTAATITTNAQAYFNGDEYVQEGADCAAGKFVLRARMGTSNIEKSQKMDNTDLSESILDFLFEPIPDDITPVDNFNKTMCDGGPIYVSGADDADGMYNMGDEVTAQDGGDTTYQMGENVLAKFDGSWKLQTPGAVMDSERAELKVGKFYMNVRLSCDSCHGDLLTEKARIKTLSDEVQELKNEKANQMKEYGDLEEKMNGMIDPADCPDAPTCPVCDECQPCQGPDECESCPTCPEPTCPECDECPTCPDGVECDECQPCDQPASCYDDLSSPLLFDNDYWFCDELKPDDCDHAAHGPKVQDACRKLCGTCTDVDICDEKFHTKVVIDGVGSIYCDQIYPEECDEYANVRDTCCRTCKK